MKDIENVRNISIIIISYNNPDLLRKTLNSIIENDTNLSYEIIVVDNASVENNLQLMEEEFHQINVIKNKCNKGFARACNQAAILASGEYLMFVNSDIYFEDDPFNKLFNILKTNTSIGLLGAMLTNSDGSLQLSYYGFPKVTKRIVELLGVKKAILRTRKIQSPTNNQLKFVDIVKGAFFMVRRNLFTSINGFDEDYFMYVEDADLSFRLSKLGYRNAVTNIGTIYHSGEHHESPSNRFIFYYRNKGLINFYKKNYNHTFYYSFIVLNLLLCNIKYHLAKFKKNIFLAKNYRIVSQLYMKYLRN